MGAHDFLLGAGEDGDDSRSLCAVCNIAWREHPDGPIDEALRLAGFGSFEDYVVARTGQTLVEMAAELGVKEQRFIVYHARWVDEQRSAIKED